MWYQSKRVATGSRAASSSISWHPFAPQKNRGSGNWGQLGNFFRGTPSLARVRTRARILSGHATRPLEGTSFRYWVEICRISSRSGWGVRPSSRLGSFGSRVVITRQCKPHLRFGKGLLYALAYVFEGPSYRLKGRIACVQSEEIDSG